MVFLRMKLEDLVMVSPQLRVRADVGVSSVVSLVN